MSIINIFNYTCNPNNITNGTFTKKNAFAVLIKSRFFTTIFIFSFIYFPAVLGLGNQKFLSLQILVVQLCLVCFFFFGINYHLKSET